MENSSAIASPDQEGIEDADGIPAKLRSSIRFTKRSLLQEVPVMIKHLHPELTNLEEIQDDDGFKTPPDQKIKPILECPGAPRKKKIVLPKRKKRKSACSRKLVFGELIEKTLENEINNVPVRRASLFDRAID